MGSSLCWAPSNPDTANLQVAGEKMGYLLFEISAGKQNGKTEAPTNSQQFEGIISARGQEMSAEAI